MLGHGWPKKNFHEPPLLDNIVRKCYISTCCAHEAAFFPVNVHLLGAHSGLGLAVCTSLGLLIGAYVFFFSFVCCFSETCSTVGQRTALVALHPSMHFTGGS